MKYQGANQIAIASLKYLKKTKLKNFSKVSVQLRKARPTAVVLHNCRICFHEMGSASMSVLMELF